MSQRDKMCYMIIVRKFALKLASLFPSAVNPTSIAYCPIWSTCLNLNLNRVCSDMTPLAYSWNGHEPKLSCMPPPNLIKKISCVALAYVVEGLFLQYASLLWYRTKTHIISSSFAQSRHLLHHADAISQATIAVLFHRVRFSLIS
jgi:hypothetical protein